MQKHWGKRMGWSVLLGVIATVVLLGFRQSTHQGPWVLGQTQLPEVTVVANRYFQVNHLRDFRYDSSGEIRSADLRQSTYDIDLLQDVWLGVSHFSGMGLAHAFVGFGFAGGQGQFGKIVDHIAVGVAQCESKTVLVKIHLVDQLEIQQQLLVIHISQCRWDLFTIYR